MKCKNNGMLVLAVLALATMTATPSLSQIANTDSLLTPRAPVRPANGYSPMPETKRQTYWMRGNDQLDLGNAALKSGNYAKACKAFKEAQKAFENSGHDDLSRQSADFADEACAHAQA